MNTTALAQSPNQVTSSGDVQIIRIDKNIAKQGIDFINTYGQEGQMIFDIVMYIANSFQNNLFNYGVFDINDFAEQLGYTVSNLKRKHPKPFQNVKMRDLDNPEMNFESIIENALYKAAKINLEFSRNVKDYTNNEEIKEIEFYQLIKTLRKHRSMKRKDVFYYTFEVSDIFTFHLSKYFTLSDISSLKALRKKNGVFLYFYLKTIQEAQRINKEDKINATPAFDILCEKAEINMSRPRDAKQKLIQKLDFIKEHTDLNFTYMFYNKNGKYKYGIKIAFLDNAKFLHDPVERKIASETTKKAMEDMIMFNLIKIYRERYQNLGRLNQGKFSEWFMSDKDKEEKFQSYFETVAIIKNTDLETTKRHHATAAREFFKRTV
jgi:hypothetical protein